MRRIVFTILLFLMHYLATAQCNYLWAKWANQGQTDSAVAYLAANGDTVGMTMTANFGFSFTSGIYGYGNFNGYPDPPPNGTVPLTTWAAGAGGVTTMCFSKPVENPVLLLASIGSGGNIVSLGFSVPYRVVYHGGNCTFTNDTTLTGREGYCIIEFPGTFTCVSIYSTTPEYYTNITWGIKNPLTANFVYQNLCMNNEVQFTDSSYTNASGSIIAYNWNFGDGNTSNKPNNLHRYATGGTYNVQLIVTSNNQCKDTVAKPVTVSSVDSSHQTQAICSGQSYVFNTHTYSATGIYYDTLKTVAGCDSIVITNLQVTPASTHTVSASICAGTPYQLPGGRMVSAAGVYADTFSSVQGCDSIIVTTVSIVPATLRNVSALICQGDSYQLPGGSVISSAGTYTDTLRAVQGCDTIVITDLSFYPPLHSTVNLVHLSCYASSQDGEIRVQATGGTAPYRFSLLGTENTTGTFAGLPAGNHSYTITDDNGCKANGSATLLQPDRITVEVTPTDTTIAGGQEVQLRAVSNYPAAEYQWSSGSYLSCQDCANPIATPLGSTTYTLTASVLIYGRTCVADAAAVIRVSSELFIPNSFTPNGDGMNDYFRVYGATPANIDEFKVEIWDRWGQKVYEATNVDFEWDGTYKAEHIPLGVYVYMVKYTLKNGKGPQVRKGGITLLK